MSRTRRRSSKNPKSSKQRQTPVDKFWSDGGFTPREAERIRPTPDPAALPRSLGEPPLTPDTAAELHLAAVYEEAVRTASALAAANGLLREDDPDQQG